MAVRVPDAVAELLIGRPSIGATEQAFPFVTVDEKGFAHVCLLSRMELDVVDDELRAVVASRRTGANLERSGRATLIAVAGTTGHYLKLRVVRQAHVEGVLAAALVVVDHIADSLGIALTPITFVVPEGLDVRENWQRTQRGGEALEHRIQCTEIADGDSIRPPHGDDDRAQPT